MNKAKEMEEMEEMEEIGIIKLLSEQLNIA